MQKPRGDHDHDITPIEIEGEHWVRIHMDGCELEPRGPFSADEAEAMAAQIAAVCRAMQAEVQCGRRPGGGGKGAQE